MCVCPRSEDSNKKPGTPGTPGSHDLEAALRRLSLRRDNYISERRFFEEERERKLAELAGKGELFSGSMTPTESIMSLGSHPSLGSGWSGYSFGARSYLPEKLQIVKPLEGDLLVLCPAPAPGHSRAPRPLPLLVVDSLWGLLLNQEEGSLSSQHSFYFRHAQPRCWFEI